MRNPSTHSLLKRPFSHSPPLPFLENHLSSQYCEPHLAEVKQRSRGGLVVLQHLLHSF